MVPGRTPTSGSGTGQSLPRLVSKCQTRGKGGFFRFWIHEKNQRAKKKNFFPLYSLAPLKGYQGEDIEIVLPGNLTVHDIDWLSVWCVQYKHNFGHVLIPKDLDVPPALGQTKITVTENRCSRSNEIPFCSIHASLNPFATKDEISRPWISLSLWNWLLSLLQTRYPEFRNEKAREISRPMASCDIFVRRDISSLAGKGLKC